jgi:hypothetical protein
MKTLYTIILALVFAQEFADYTDTLMDMIRDNRDDGKPFFEWVQA